MHLLRGAETKRLLASRGRDKEVASRGRDKEVAGAVSTYIWAMPQTVADRWIAEAVLSGERMTARHMLWLAVPADGSR